jgi:hypothetical protein
MRSRKAAPCASTKGSRELMMNLTLSSIEGGLNGHMLVVKKPNETPENEKK